MGRMIDLVFDLDGTISDPINGIHHSINFALDFHRCDQVSRSTVTGLIGPPLDEVFLSLVAGANNQEVQSLVSKYRERYSEVGCAENSLYEGVLEALGELRELGLTLGVCTSKRKDFAERILERFEIRNYFEFVDGGDIGITKTKQLEALLNDGLISTSSTVIGDRAVDILAANANGLLSAGVLWGYGSENELRGAGAGMLLANTRELSRLSIAAKEYASPDQP